MPACAAYDASAADVLPVLAHATALAPIRMACVVPTVMPRSLNEPVGLCPSCLISSPSHPVYFEIAARDNSGVFPSG